MWDVKHKEFIGNPRPCLKEIPGPAVKRFKASGELSN